MADSAERGEPSLRDRVMRGVAWTTSAAVAVQGTRLIVGIVLARLLTPHEYGVAAMALVFSALVLAVSDFGLGTGLVQRERITEADRSTVFWTSVAIGILLAGAGLALAAPVARFFGEPEVREMFMVVSASFAIAGLGKTHAALFQREMAFRAISVRVVVASSVGAVVGIVLALRGHGAWSIIWMQLANGAVTTALMWTFSPWHPRFMFSAASLRNLAGFGFNVFGTKVLEYVHGNADKILVGRFLGSASLGVYNVAYNLVVMPFVALMLSLMDGVFPAMARAQADLRRVAAQWISSTRMMVGLALPAMLGMAVVAPDFVAVVLGDRWGSAVTVVQVMCLAMAVHSVFTFATTVLTALDRTGTVLRFTIVEVPIIVAALAVGLQFGVNGVAVAYLASTVVLRSALGWLTARTLELPLRTFLGSLAGVGQAAVGMAAVAWGAREALVALGAPSFVRLAVVTLLGLLVYVMLCTLRAPDLVRELLDSRSAMRIGWLARRRDRFAVSRA